MTFIGKQQLGPGLYTCSDEELDREVKKREARKKQELEDSIARLQHLGYVVTPPAGEK